jgi:hypothetical protein
MNTTYETAPATILLATHCACCARPLVDAVSVETGIGPDCRKKHGFAAPDAEVDEAALVAALSAYSTTIGAALDLSVELEPRVLANKIVHRIAVEQDAPSVAFLVNALRALGFAKLAARVATRLVRITITAEGSDLLVVAPYSEEALTAWRGIPGRRWDKAAKATRVPAKCARPLWDLLRTHFRGVFATGPKGVFVIA